MGLYSELFYAIIPTLFPYFFADLLSLHLVTFLMFSSLVCKRKQPGMSIKLQFNYLLVTQISNRNPNTAK